MRIHLEQSAPIVARLLIGCEMTMTDEYGKRGGIITETEAYTSDDPASHSYSGVTERNRAMFMPAGTIYMYRIYGVHWCFNLVCGQSDGQAVLIREIWPTQGIEQMIMRRGISDRARLCAGPSNVVRALGIPPRLNSTHLYESSVTVLKNEAPHTYKIKTGPRIGIGRARLRPWRFYTSDLDS